MTCARLSETREFFRLMDLVLVDGTRKGSAKWSPNQLGPVRNAKMTRARINSPRISDAKALRVDARSVYLPTNKEKWAFSLVDETVAVDH